MKLVIGGLLLRCPLLGVDSFGVHSGKYIADVDLLAGLDVEFGEHTVAGRGHRVLHLHGLQPDQRLPGGDGVAHRRADAQHRARHRRQQRTLRDGGVGIRKARQRNELHRPERRVDEYLVAVAGHVERPLHAVDREHHPFGLRAHQCHGSVVGSRRSSPVRVNR